MAGPVDLARLRALAERRDAAALPEIPALLDRLEAAEARIDLLQKVLAELADQYGATTAARSLLGLAHGNAKLTPAQIEAIRADKRSLRILAAEHGVHFSTISKIKGGKHGTPRAADQAAIRVTRAKLA